MTKLLCCLIVLLLGITTNAYAHLSQEILKCPVFAGIRPIHKPKLLKVNFTENGLFSELYDVNNDGKIDIVVYSAIIDTRGPLQDTLHKFSPTFYELDEDNDGEPDALYIDRMGEQKCEDLILYSIEDGNSGGLASWHDSRDSILVSN